MAVEEPASTTAESCDAMATGGEDNDAGLESGWGGSCGTVGIFVPDDEDDVGSLTAVAGGDGRVEATGEWAF